MYKESIKEIKADPPVLGLPGRAISQMNGTL